MNLFDVYPLFVRHQHRQRERLPRVGRERYGVPRPLRRPCRHLHRPRPSALRGDDQPPGSHPGLLLQLRHQQAPTAGGRTPGQGQRLRGLLALPHQQRCRSQRERPEAGLLPQRTHTGGVLCQSLPRPYVAGRRGDQQPQNHRPHQRLRARHLPAAQRHGRHAGRTGQG